MVISCPPIAFISSRMMALILLDHPLSQGEKHIDPRRQLPDVARADHQTWLIASASAGSSFSVGMSDRDQRIACSPR